MAETAFGRFETSEPAARRSESSDMRSQCLFCLGRLSGWSLGAALCSLAFRLLGACRRAPRSHRGIVSRFNKRLGNRTQHWPFSGMAGEQDLRHRDAWPPLGQFTQDCYARTVPFLLASHSMSPGTSQEMGYRLGIHSFRTGRPLQGIYKYKTSQPHQDFSPPGAEGSF